MLAAADSSTTQDGSSSSPSTAAHMPAFDPSKVLRVRTAEDDALEQQLVDYIAELKSKTRIAREAAAAAARSAADPIAGGVCAEVNLPSL